MSGRLLGRVVQRDGKPAAGVKVAVELVQDITGPRVVAGVGVTDRDGLFHLCRGIPVGRMLIVRAQYGAASPVTERVQVTPSVTTVPVEMP